MAEDEKKRLEDQRVKLGEEGLAEMAKQLQDAMDFNEVTFLSRPIKIKAIFLAHKF